MMVRVSVLSFLVTFFRYSLIVYGFIVDFYSISILSNVIIGYANWSLESYVGFGLCGASKSMFNHHRLIKHYNIFIM